MYEPFYIFTKKTGACFSRALPPRKKSFSRESAGLGASQKKMAILARSPDAFFLEKHQHT
jgi:hypothetical protein